MALALEEPTASEFANSVGMESQFLATYGLVLRRVASHSWSVRENDTGLARQVIVACIDEKNDEFEVMEMRDGFTWTTFPSFHDAATYLAVDRGPAIRSAR